MFDGSISNRPVTMVAIWNWITDVHAAGGTLSYDRSDTDTDIPVPPNMTWLNMGNGTRSDFSDGGA